MVAARKAGNLPAPALELVKETEWFSAEFHRQLQQEEQLAAKDLKPVGKGEIREVLFKLTPYVNVALDSTGKKVTVCSECGFIYGPAGEDFKLYSLVYERDPDEVYPKHLAPDKEWAVLLEFYCPGCGRQTEVDQTPPGMPIVPHAIIAELAQK
ncbi:MAG: hypothetical protein D9V47_00735 [Clostridia bacterium]|nr:MAG: hypothetical protein D9V47_00735 [Clostridia bacterium]